MYVLFVPWPRSQHLVGSMWDLVLLGCWDGGIPLRYHLFEVAVCSAWFFPVYRFIPIVFFGIPSWIFLEWETETYMDMNKSIMTLFYAWLSLIQIVVCPHLADHRCAPWCFSPFFSSTSKASTLVRFSTPHTWFPGCKVDGRGVWHKNQGSLHPLKI